MQLLDTISQILTDNLGPFGPLILVGTLGILLILLTIPILVRQSKDPLDKLKKANRTGQAEEVTKKTPPHERP